MLLNAVRSVDQPAEVIVRGDELIVVNMDMPWSDPHGYDLVWKGYLLIY